MALIAKIALDSGLTVDDAYIRIDDVRGDKAQMLATASVFASREARETGKPALQTLYATFIPRIGDDDVSIWTQAYVALRALPALSRSQDELSVQKPPAIAGRPMDHWLIASR